MNNDADCHEIPDCPGVYVDAFHGSYLTQKTKKQENTFILSHYHGDHYGRLPREGGYEGPALIHCTPITAQLLVHVHGVHDSLVVAHALGETWSLEGAFGKSKSTHVTFYDANHCPGAAIILFETSEGKYHLHTGDMRYDQRMETYPLLRQAALNRKIDTVFLDTTYAHPKHSFLPQNEAVNSIASQASELLRSDQPKTLILLSCYNIGKEKVLWEVANRTQELIYANERKRRMLECIHSGNDDQDSCFNIINRCTDDPSKSDVHIIPMGLAGKIWPFFQPDYKSCLEYAKEQTNAQYERVVAFLPTGWADASNWNKKNACKTLTMEGVTISVRLVAYSEHSTFAELQSMVSFLKPRFVMPTVYSDKNDQRRIQDRFRGCIDTRRAKEAFFRSMSVHTESVHGGENSDLPASRAAKRNIPQHRGHEIKEKQSQDMVKLSQISGCSQTRKRPPPDEPSDTQTKKQLKESDVESLVAMGFSEESVKEALKTTGSHVSAALDCLLGTNASSSNSASSCPNSRVTPSPKVSQKGRRSTPSKAEGNHTITSFFAPKKR